MNYDNRPFANAEEMHEYMLRRWNEKVTNGDTVYILGDVALRGKRDALIGRVAQRNDFAVRAHAQFCGGEVLPGVYRKDE